jgi:hypothetical protein
MTQTGEIITDEEKRNRIKFFAFIIPEFARSYKMNKQVAYQFLKENGGLDFLFKHWWALHTDNPMYVVRDLYDECYKNGGKR